MIGTNYFKTENKDANYDRQNGEYAVGGDGEEEEEEENTSFEYDGDNQDDSDVSNDFYEDKNTQKIQKNIKKYKNKLEKVENVYPVRMPERTEDSVITSMVCSAKFDINKTPFLVLFFSFI